MWESSKGQTKTGVWIDRSHWSEGYVDHQLVFIVLIDLNIDFEQVKSVDRQ